jgi:hypothetical protein
LRSEKYGRRDSKSHALSEARTQCTAPTNAATSNALTSAGPVADITDPINAVAAGGIVVVTSQHCRNITLLPIIGVFLQPNGRWHCAEGTGILWTKRDY